MGFADKVREFCAGYPARADQYEALIDQIVLQRLRGPVADEQTLLDLGVAGPLLRAAGNPWDLRKAAPYSSYDHFEFKIPSARSATTTTATGCGWRRCASR